jgi:hypothetical protein
MDNDALTTAGLTSGLTIGVAVLYKIYMAINHKRCKSRCCNYDIENSIDIGEITPPDVVVPADNFINNPLQNQKN